MQSVEVDVVSNDRLPELREMASTAMADAAEGAARRQAALGGAGAWSVEEVDAVRKGAEEDIRAGRYTRCNFHTFTAFKP